MIPKLFLCAVIIGMCWFLGRLRARKLKQRVNCFEEMEEILRGLEADMKNEMMTLASALQREASGERAFAGLLASCAQKLKASPGRAFGDIWEEELKRELRENSLMECLNKEDAVLLQKTGKNLVNASIMTQETHFALLHREFALTAEKARAEQGRKTKLYNSIGLMTGFFIAILLL